MISVERRDLETGRRGLTTLANEAQTPPLILIEFNELCPSLLEDFMRQGLLPNFKSFHDSSLVFLTDAGERDLNLNPWIQWPTVHSGMPYSEHRVFNLGDGRALERKCLAELLSDDGIRCGVFMSMNMNYRQLNGYNLPDPWDKLGEADPEWLQPYYRFVSQQVQESSREKSLSKGELAKFVVTARRNGLTLQTAAALAQQLVRERVNPGVRWKRAALLDRLQYDVFRRLNQRLKIRFATFFSNSTAHFQHYYWRNMEPQQFLIPPSDTDEPSLRLAIRFGYQSMDALLGRMMKDYKDALLILCTALSQQAWRETTKCTYRPKNWEAFLGFAGLPLQNLEVKPVMAEQFHLECSDEESAKQVEDKLGRLTLNGTKIMTTTRNDRSVFAGCALHRHVSNDEQVIRTTDGSMVRFVELFHLVHTMRSGCHHPDGALWVRNGRHRLIEGRVPLTDIAPTVLKHFDVPQPSYMRGEPLPIN